jgi:hypothetical protein
MDKVQKHNSFNSELLLDTVSEPESERGSA